MTRPRMMTLNEIIDIYESYGVCYDALMIMQGLRDLGWRDEYLLQMNLEQVRDMLAEGAFGDEGAGMLLEGAIFHAAFSGCGPKPLRLLKALAYGKASPDYDLQTMQLLIDLNWVDLTGNMGPDARSYVQSMTSRPERRQLGVEP